MTRRSISGVPQNISSTATQTGIQRRADGSGSEEFVMADAFGPVVSIDGAWLLYTTVPDATTSNEIRGYDLDTRETIRLDTLNSFKSSLATSTDGRYLADYEHMQDTREIVMRSMDGASRWQATTDGFINPAWSPGGEYLYFQDLNYHRQRRWIPLSSGNASGRPVPL